jgi:nucleotide-binding universal stress UspA family protein
MFDKILVAYHGSDRAMRAFDAAIELARQRNTPLYLINIEEELPRHAELIAEIESARERQDSHTSRLAEQARRHAELHGVSLICAVAHGSKVRMIVDFARNGNFDLLVIGASRQSLANLLFGSPSERFMTLAPCSVLAVK